MDTITIHRTLNSKYLPLGTQNEIGIPVVYKVNCSETDYTLSSDVFSFVSWTTKKTTKSKENTATTGYDYDPEVTPELKDYVSDGDNLNSKVTGNTENPSNLNLHPLFYKTPYRPVAINKEGNADQPINLPRVTETLSSVSFTLITS